MITLLLTLVALLVIAFVGGVIWAIVEIAPALLLIFLLPLVDFLIIRWVIKKIKTKKE